jgi:type VI secretion system protein ImpH
MAAAGGAERTALNTPERFAKVEQKLRTEPWCFSFFQAVRLLERILPHRSPVGGFFHPDREVARFGSYWGSAFPASEIQQIRWEAGEGAPMLIVNFMGLTGPSGVLPLYYSELIRDRLRAKDSTMLAFFDLFNHRMISLFYQAWEKYRFAVAYERGERDRFSHHLLDLIGLGTTGLQNRQAVADDSLLFYSGLFALHARSAEGLRGILEDYFEVPVEIRQFIGSWRRLEISDQCGFEGVPGVSEQLGLGAVVGDEIWDQQSGVRIRLGPLTFEQYVEFLPEGSAWAPLTAIARLYAGEGTDFEVQLVLRRDETPACGLSAPGDFIPQLGWTSWAKTRPIGRDPEETILKIELPVTPGDGGNVWR